MKEMIPFIYPFIMGFVACFVIMAIGCVIHHSQKSAEDVDTRIKLNVYTFNEDDTYSSHVVPVRDQDDAQQRLNEFLFSRIRSAHVSDPISGMTLAKMDQYGRLIGV